MEIWNGQKDYEDWIGDLEYHMMGPHGGRRCRKDVGAIHLAWRQEGEGGVQPSKEHAKG